MTHVDAMLLIHLTRVIAQLVEDVVELRVSHGVARPPFDLRVVLVLVPEVKTLLSTP